MPDTTQVYSFAVYQGRLHVCTWPNGSVFVYDPPSKNVWTNVGRLGEEKEVMGVAVYNGKLYAGTLPLGAVFRYDGPNRWTLTGQLDTTPDVTYRRVWSMAVYQGRLFAGTLPSGHVFSLEAGKCATYDRELAPGWRHVAAVKAGGPLKLYVDGQCVATSSQFDPAEYDLSNPSPLRIGFGQHDYFNGRMRDLRLYRRRARRGGDPLAGNSIGPAWAEGESVVVLWRLSVREVLSRPGLCAPHPDEHCHRGDRGGFHQHHHDGDAAGLPGDVRHRDRPGPARSDRRRRRELCRNRSRHRGRGPGSRATVPVLQRHTVMHFQQRKVQRTCAGRRSGPR